MSFCLDEKIVCKRCREQPKLYSEKHGPTWLACDCSNVKTRVTPEQVASADVDEPWRPESEVAKCEECDSSKGLHDSECSGKGLVEADVK